MGQQQVQQPDQSQGQAQKSKQFPWKRIGIVIIIIAFLLAFACIILWNLINMGVLHGAFFDTLSKILVAIGSAATAIGGVLTVYVGIAFSLKSFFTPSNEKTESPPELVDTATAPPTSAPSSLPIIIQLQPQVPPTIPQPSPIHDKPISSNIIGTFPPTDPKAIQQRRTVVEHWDSVSAWKCPEVAVERSILLHNHDDMPDFVNITVLKGGIGTPAGIGTTAGSSRSAGRKRCSCQKKRQDDGEKVLGSFSVVIPEYFH